MRLDLLYVARSIRRSPASAGAAVLTLSLTLGAGASIFAVVHAVLLTPPPFKDPEALVILGESPVDGPTAGRAVRYATFEAWRERAGSLAALEAIDGTNLTLTEAGAAERLSANDVTPGFLALLGITPALGRSFAPDDVGRPIAIVSSEFWRRKLGADRDVIGRQIVLGGQPHAIVGVLPERFVFELNPSDIWRPLPLTLAQAARTGYRVSAVARLTATASPPVLAAALDDVSRDSSPPARVVAVPIAVAISGDAARTLNLLAGAAALALLIAFTNFAGLLVVRSIDRRQELAIRRALGARDADIAKQLVLEAQALVAVGIVAGVLLALWTTPTVARLALEQFGGVALRDVPINWRVITVVAAGAALGAAICALLATLMTARRNVLDVLRRGATPPPRELLLRRVFVAGEIALAFVLLTCMSLLAGSVVHLLKTSPGFEARGVVTMKVSVPAASYDVERVLSFYSTLHSTLEDRLGRRSVGIVNEMPLTHDRGRAVVDVRPNEVGPEAVVREASPGYFDVMRIALVSGRAFDPRDNSSAPPSVVISTALARRLFGSDPPVGRRLWIAGAPQPAAIIGVVGDVKHRALDEAVLPTVYLSAFQAPSRSRIIVVRSERPAADVIAAVREDVARLDGNLPVYGAVSMDEVVAASPGMPARRVLTAMFSGFAMLALVLGAIGLFGVVAHDVASRRVELALRLALGAAPGNIVRRTLRQGAMLVGAGLMLGGVLSVWAVRALRGAVVATPRADALGIGVAAVVLVATGIGAVLPAALRAARTDPSLALRSE